jgi:DNA mismatch repair protein MutL
LSKIKILSENLANQIAAGEVVERPASVVKELLENAIDAGAEHVSIYVEGGGTRLIRVVDDGEGMDQDDILLCLERHATSKVSSAESLSAIKTLGFRGEAIPSIASVSKLVITSRPQNVSLGSQAEVKFGRLVKVHEMGSQPGTVMEVGNLFGNVPARKKFLKTAQTELSHVYEIITNYGLAYHGLGITYLVDQKVVLELSKGGSGLEERVLALLGGRTNSPLVPVNPDRSIRTTFGSVHGYLLPPEESFGARAKLRLFVNGRSVRDRMLSHAISEGMHGFLMKGNRPAGAFFIDIAPEMVDVNVHPTKQEVRFQKSGELHDYIVSAVQMAMAEYQKKLKGLLFVQPHEQKSINKAVENVTIYSKSMAQSQLPLKTEVREQEGDFQQAGVFGRPGKLNDTSAVSGTEKRHSFASSHHPAPMEITPPATEKGAAVSSIDVVKDGRHGECRLQQPFSAEHSSASLRVIGQLMGSYILCEKERNFIIIDQHAAHERIFFEMFKEQYSSGAFASQVLMFPKVIEYGAAEIRILDRYHDEIARMGIDISDFGGGSYAVKAVPALLSHLSPEEIVEGILEQFVSESTQEKSTPIRVENILASMACKAAVKANHALQPAEIETLLEKMQESPSFSHCPHGRPVLKHFSEYDIKKWFRRT